jgi:acyl-[acyl carrier protein]--UDP-N-acetylglucosamine O-acyltransferase
MSDVQIHPTAIIDSGAEIGSGTIVGPYCVIGSDVVLGANCWLQHHVTLCGPMKAGEKNRFYAYCSIGQQTQDLKYRCEPTYLEIGGENTFREFVTVQVKAKRESVIAEIFSLTVTSGTIAPWAITSFSPTTGRWAVMFRWKITR